MTKTFTLIFFLQICISTNAQWVKTSLPSNESVFSLAASGDTVFAGTYANGIYRSTDNGENWTLANNGLSANNAYSFAISGTNIFVGTEKGIFLSTDNGSNWNQTGLLYGTVHCVLVTDSNIYAGSYDDGVHVSTNKGVSWVMIIPPYSIHDVRSLVLFGNNIYVGAYDLGIYISTNNGTNWSHANNGIITKDIMSLGSIGANMVTGTDTGLYISTNGGSDWTFEGQVSPFVYANTFAVSGNFIFAGARDGVYLSKDDGLYWHPINYPGLNTHWITSLAISENYIFAGSQRLGLYRRPLAEALPVELTSFTAKIINGSVNLNWKTTSEVNNQGFEIERKSDASDWEKIGFVKGSGNSNHPNAYSFIDHNSQDGKFKYRLRQFDNDGNSEYSKSIEIVLSSPCKYELSQNYPNPFNPTTTIKYSIQKDGNVKLTVYNSIGSKVATIVDGYESAGNYSIEFNGSNLASGIYLYRLEAGDYSASKKFIMIK